MTTKDEALKLALEALEESVDLVREDYENAKKLYGKYPSRQARLLGMEDGLLKHENAIAAIKQALAAPVQEPVRLQCVHCGTVYADGVPPALPAQKPMVFLSNGTRFKISYDNRQSGGKIHGIPPELGGRWVAFVAAEDDCHMKLISPPAAPVQEPSGFFRYEDVCGDEVGPPTPYYLTPPEAPTQEPVAIVHPHGATVRLQWAGVSAAHNAKPGPLYSTPPAAQRQWVGLTNQELVDLTSIYSGAPLYRAIEAKLRSKNT